MQTRNASILIHLPCSTYSPSPTCHFCLLNILAILSNFLHFHLLQIPLKSSWIYRSASKSFSTNSQQQYFHNQLYLFTISERTSTASHCHGCNYLTITCSCLLNTHPNYLHLLIIISILTISSYPYSCDFLWNLPQLYFHIELFFLIM